MLQLRSTTLGFGVLFGYYLEHKKVDKRAHGFGQLLRQHRRRMDLTQDQLAQHVGCSLSALKKIESELRRPSKDMVARLSLVLGLSSIEAATFLATRRMVQTRKDVSSAGGLPPNEGAPAIMDVLPVPPTTLIGRRQELAKLARLLQGTAHRFIEITALGGLGKTHLALVAAEESKTHFRDGVHLVRMTGMSTPKHVLLAIAKRFGIADVGDDLPNTGAAVMYMPFHMARCCLG